MGLFPKGQLAYCPKRNMAREKQGPNDDRPGKPQLTPPGEAQDPPPRAAAYIPPMAAPKESRYHTIDMKAVRLSPDIDPQRMKTQLSLRAVKAAPKKNPSRAPAWVALLLVGGAIGTCAWWFASWRRVNHHDSPGLPAKEAAVAAIPVSSVSAGADIARVVTDPTPSSQTQGAPIGVVDSETAVVPRSARIPTGTASPTVSAAPAGTVTPLRGTSTGDVVRPAPKPRPTPRKVSQPKTPAVDEPTSVAPNSPKLWLE